MFDAPPPTSTTSIGPDDTERAGLKLAPAADFIVHTVMEHFRRKLGREPSVAEIARWGDVYVRAGRGLQQIAATRKALAGTEGGKRRAHRRTKAAEPPPAPEPHPSLLRDEAAVEDDRRRGRPYPGSAAPHFELPSALVGSGKKARAR